MAFDIFVSHGSPQSEWVGALCYCSVNVLCSGLDDGSFMSSTYPQHSFHSVNGQSGHEDQHGDSISSASAAGSVGGVLPIASNRFFFFCNALNASSRSTQPSILHEIVK